MDHFYLVKGRRAELACFPNSGMVHDRFTINNSPVRLDPPRLSGNWRSEFSSGEQGNKCPKRRGTGKQIKFRGTWNIRNIILILVKHGNKPFISEE